MDVASRGACHVWHGAHAGQYWLPVGPLGAGRPCPPALPACEWVTTAMVQAMKQRHAMRRLHTEHASSSENSTPPMGAPAAPGGGEGHILGRNTGLAGSMPSSPSSRKEEDNCQHQDLLCLQRFGRGWARQAS